MRSWKTHQQNLYPHQALAPPVNDRPVTDKRRPYRIICNPTAGGAETLRSARGRIRIDALKSHVVAHLPVLASRPLRGVLALVSGSATGQLVALAAAPILARIYSPASFGEFSYVISLCMILVTVASLSFEAAVPLAGSTCDAQRLTRLALASAGLTTLVVTLLVALFSPLITQAAGFEMTPWVWWLPALLWVTSVFVVLSQAALRDRSYYPVARRTLTQNVGTSVTQVGLGTVTQSAAGLLTGQFVGRLLGIVSLGSTVHELLSRPTEGGYRGTIKRYWRFPLVYTPSAALNVLGAQLPLILIGIGFGVQSAGYLGVAQRIVVIPAGLIGIAVTQVFSAEISSRLRSGVRENRSIYIRASIRLGTLGVCLTVGVVTLSPVVFPAALGQQWVPAGAFAQAMGLSAGLGLLAVPTSFVLVAYQRTVVFLFLAVSRIALILGFGWLAYANGMGAVATIWAMYAGQAVNYAATWIIGLRVVSLE